MNQTDQRHQMNQWNQMNPTSRMNQMDQLNKMDQTHEMKQMNQHVFIYTLLGTQTYSYTATECMSFRKQLAKHWMNNLCMNKTNEQANLYSHIAGDTNILICWH